MKVESNSKILSYKEKLALELARQKGLITVSSIRSIYLGKETAARALEHLVILKLIKYDEKVNCWRLKRD